LPKSYLIGKHLSIPIPMLQSGLLPGSGFVLADDTSIENRMVGLERKVHMAMRLSEPDRNVQVLVTE